MNETLKQFKENQKRNQENLEKLLDFVKTGEKYGIKIEESFKKKINSAIQSVADQKLRVALVGGFSEGKTSIAATWIERLDKSMKIDHQESSDAVKIYNIDNEIELVDTPGLFGFKEKISDSGEIERYKDITKKYVSEAHLILYMLNSYDFVIREIGDKGINIETKIQNAFGRETQGILNEIAKIETSFNADMSFFEKHAGTFGKIGNEFLIKSGFINATNIKLARDTIAAVGKFVGVDLFFKFKPWEAVKWAGNLNKALPFIGFAFEAWDSWNKYQKEQALEEAKEKMVSHFDNQKKEILDFINDETRFKQTCFLSALELEKSLQEIKEAIEKTQAYDQEFEKWIKAGKDLIKGEDFIEVEPEEE
ncbi:hypothetical protein HpKG83_05860 [Helicobacter pylori]